MTENSLLDLPLDENDDQLRVLPVSHSTPQKPKRQSDSSQLVCPQCGKKYVLKHYFTKHLKSHDNQVTDADSDLSQSIHLNASDVSFSQLSSTQTNTAGTFKVPALPAPRKRATSTNTKTKTSSQLPKKKPHLICTYCLKGYVDSRSFKTHVRTHLMQEAASHLPDTKEIMEHSEEIGMKSLIKVSNEPCFGESPAEYRQLVGHVVSISSSDEWKKFSNGICAELVKSVDKKKCLLPSALVNSLMEYQEIILNDFDLCDIFLDIIGVNAQFSVDVSAIFFLKFMLYFTTELLQFISRTFRANLPRRSVAKPLAEPDQEDRRVIYYIAGSIVRGYLKIARRFPQSKMWQEVAFVLKNKLLVEEPEGDLIADAEWTSDVNRGALLFINSPTQKLFVKICELVFSCEQKDGSIDYEAVIKEVCNSQLSVDWDNIIGVSLSETVSFNLLSDVTKCFCRTCGRGVAKRRLNFIRSRPIASLTTRHLAASRKNR